MWRDGQRGKRVRAREQQNEEGAISPFYSVNAYLAVAR